MQRRAFTLIEMLIVLAIVLTLAGMVVGVGFMWVGKAKVQVTYQQMEQITTQLKVYSNLDGSSCASLQKHFDLGGAIAFAPLYKVANVVRMDGGGEQGSLIFSGVDFGGKNDRYFPPPILVWYENNSSYLWLPNQRKSRDSKPGREVESVFRRTIEVVPPEEGPIPANYGKNDDTFDRHDNWYVDTWPYVWPLSDWDLDDPGMVPPILRFPWGSPGLRIDGTPVDPDLPSTDLIGFLDKRMYGETRPDTKHPRYKKDSELGDHSKKAFGSDGLAVPNAWSVFGELQYNDGGRVNESCSWDELDGAEQDAVVYATRSDGSDPGVAANKPQPFDVGLMSPLKTMELLQASGMLPPGEAGRQLYRSDRSPGKSWNDQWGNPLIIAYALFQPERYECIGNDGTQRTETTTRHRGLMLEASMKYYGYNRALYLVGGAAGQRLEADAQWDGYPGAWDPADDAKVLRGLWRQIRRVCKAEEWTEEVMGGGERPGSWSSGGKKVSKWDSYRTGKDGKLECVITQVFEVQ